MRSDQRSGIVHTLDSQDTIVKEWRGLGGDSMRWTRQFGHNKESDKYIRSLKSCPRKVKGSGKGCRKWGSGFVVVRAREAMQGMPEIRLGSYEGIFPSGGSLHQEWVLRGKR